MLSGMPMKCSENGNQKSKAALSLILFFKPCLWFIIIGGFAAFLILYLYNSNVGLFRKSSIIAAEESDSETGDIFAINYQREIDKSVASGNYRLAVRLMFLRLLKNLSDKNIIQYKQDNTNLDYLMQLQTRRHVR